MKKFKLEFPTMKIGYLREWSDPTPTHGMRCGSQKIDDRGNKNFSKI